MTEEDAKYIWEQMLDNVQRYGIRYWCSDSNIDMDHLIFFCETVDTMIQETDWSIYGR